MAKAIFCSAYLPSVEYISSLLKFPSVQMEACENFPKQTLRNRCHILSANGVQTLCIPIMHEQTKILIKDLKINYSQSWQRIHWMALQSAYNKSPFFEFYKDDFEKIIFSNKTFLLDLNLELLLLILKIIGAEIQLSSTSAFEKTYPENDFRFLSNAKRTLNLKPQTLNHTYSQVFNYKFGFTSNLSIVDLIFNKGKASIDYLQY
jgi:hypothetical protein